MDFEAVKSWLEKFTNKRIKQCRMAGMIGFICSPLVIILAVALLYGLLRLMTYRRFGAESHAACLWVSLGLVPVMFVGNRIVPHSNLMEERMSEGPADSLIGHQAAKGEVYLQFFLWIMFAGPRLIDWSWEKFRNAKQLQVQDTHGCAAVLWLLLSRHKKVPYEEIQRELPWLNPDTAIPEARNIPGVIHLQVEPAGLTLAQNLRMAIRSGKLEIDDG